MASASARPAVFIMAAIEPDLGPFRRDVADAALDEILEAGWPVDLRHAALEGIEAQIRLDAAQGGDGRRRILKLVAAGQARQGQIEKAASILENEAADVPCGRKNRAPRRSPAHLRARLQAAAPDARRHAGR